MTYLLELYLRDVGVGGSNPLTPTTKPLIYNIFRVSQFSAVSRKNRKIVVTHWLHITHLLF